MDTYNLQRDSNLFPNTFFVVHNNKTLEQIEANRKMNHCIETQNSSYTAIVGAQL